MSSKQESQKKQHLRHLKRASFLKKCKKQIKLFRQDNVKIEEVQSLLDQARMKKILHKNKVNRMISELYKYRNKR